MNELDGLLEKLGVVEDNIILETTERLSDEQKFLILFLFMKSKDPEFSTNFKSIVREGMRGYYDVRDEMLRSLNKLNEPSQNIRDWGEGGRIDGDVKKILKRYKKTEIDGILDKTSESLQNQIAILTAFKFSMTRKVITDIVERTHVVRYARVFADPKTYSNGIVFDNKKFGLYAVRPGLGPLVIKTTRKFCKQHAGEIKPMEMWRNMVDKFPISPGGINCRHIIIGLSEKKKQELSNNEV